MIIGALEAGGTKMVCAIGKENGEILEQISIPTTVPKETMPKLIHYFKEKKIEALGIGAFGPVDVNKNSETYGCILDTPKVAWQQFDLLGSFQKELKIPMGFDTDVNASCLGEVRFGCAKNLDTVLYLTIGTGIGAGIYTGGLLHGMLHPEAGHILMAKHPKDPGESVCPYHKNCFEGFATGPSIEKRWGKKGHELQDKKEVWLLESFYIAQALVNYILILSPQKIILGGGVMHQEQLFPMIRKQVIALLNGYLKTKELEAIDDYIVMSALKDNQGIMGCIELANQKLKEV